MGKSFRNRVKAAAESDLRYFKEFMDWQVENGPVQDYTEDAIQCMFCHNTEGPFGNMVFKEHVMDLPTFRWCVTHQGAAPLHKWDCTKLMRGCVIFSGLPVEVRPDLFSL